MVFLGVRGTMSKCEKVDIIIPIYNAYEDLVKCVASIFRHTDLSGNRLILVDDKSTDKRIREYLHNIGGENVIVHFAERNSGFSASVNIGMQYSQENDVVLLNSDTIVTSRWIDKIARCAYLEESIGTVTPLSNSATIASYPVFGQDNPLPNNVSVDELADIVERCSLNMYPQITVAVGFCMFIKRRLINEIGLFDEETFGKGYGEENDFCCRAELMGYKHVLCDDTFIYHKGTVSFNTEQKRTLAKEHEKILVDRYPASIRNNHLFCMGKPYQKIRDNITEYVKLNNGKKNILYVLHSDFQDDVCGNVGGTQLHVKDLTLNLKSEFNIYVLVKDERCYRLTGYIDDKIYTYEYSDRNVNVYPIFYDAYQKEMLENIVYKFNINLVHVHHICGMSLDVYYVASERKIPIITTIHDYYMLCPTYFLFNTTEGRFCGGKIDERCEYCMKSQISIYGGKRYLEKWRKEMRKALELNSMIVFPSKSAQEVFCNIYPINNPSKIIGHGINNEEDEEKLEISPNGMDEVKVCLEKVDLQKSNLIEGWAFWKGTDNHKIKIIIQIINNGAVVQTIKTNKSRRQDVDDAFDGKGKYVYSGFNARVNKADLALSAVDIRVLLCSKEKNILAEEMRNVPVMQEEIGEGMRVAFIGGISNIKGSRIAYELVLKVDDIEWFVFGNISPTEALYNLDKLNLHKFGAYERKNIKKLLQANRIDLVCIFSECSETFCYTLSEALDAKVPVLAYDIGAVGERVRNENIGKVVSLSAAAEDIIKEIRKSNSENSWKEIRSNVDRHVIKDVRKMCEEYISVYKMLMLETD